MNSENTSRTEYAAKNMTVAVIGNVVSMLLGFASRVVFTHTLSTAYVGINGLFIDILTVLSLSELGFGTAVSFALYQPIKDGNIEKQKSYMQVIKKFYFFVAALILVLGLCLIPFLGFFVKNSDAIDHLTLIYLLYLGNTVISYWNIYKKTLLDACQLNHVTVFSRNVCWSVQIILQIIVLLVTKNFILYVCLMVLGTICGNILISNKADRLYPFLKDKNVSRLEPEENREITKNVKALILHKVGDVAINNTDNLLLSSIVGITAAGLYSNYYLVIEAVRGIFKQVFQSITGSIGNLGVSSDKQHIKRVFEATFFLSHWLYGMAAVILYEVLAPFISISFGGQYVFEQNITFILCLNFYVTGMREANLAFRDSLGLFYYDRYKSICAAIINLAVSIWLGTWLGTIGIFIGTFVSTMTTSFWVEPYILYKKRLDSPLHMYFIRYALYFLSTGLLWWCCDWVCSRFSLGTIGTIVVNFFICALIMNLGYLGLFFWTPQFKLLYSKGMFLLKKKLFSKSQATEREEKAKEDPSWLTDLMKETLTGKKLEISLPEDGKLIQTMGEREIASLLYGDEQRKFSGPSEQFLLKSAQASVKRFDRLFYTTLHTLGILKEVGLEVCVLKGLDLAAAYPVPEYRSFGDVDLFLKDTAGKEEAEKLLLENGYCLGREQTSKHHLVFLSPDGIEVELHLEMNRDFDDEGVNRAISEIFHREELCFSDNSLWGVTFPVLPKAENALYLLIHMLQHYLNAGFGFKLLCDWTVFWNGQEDLAFVKDYRAYVEKLGLEKFADCITAISEKYLGLKREIRESLSFGCETGDVEKEMLGEIYSAGRYGELEKDRMVSLKSASLKGLVKEFHHQMKYNYPRTGKIWILWPALWVLTLVRFLKNSKKIRKVRWQDTVKKAKDRAATTEKLNLFVKY